MQYNRYLFTVLLWLTTSSVSLAAQKSLKDEALADRKAFAHMMLGDFGWIFLGCAAILTCWDWMIERDNKVLVKFSAIMITYFILAKIFG